MLQVGYVTFLLAEDKDSHTLCISCRGKSSSADDHWSDCHDWTDKKWEKVSAYHEKLAIQQEKKRERKAESCPSSF